MRHWKVKKKKNSAGTELVTGRGGDGGTLAPECSAPDLWLAALPGAPDPFWPALVQPWVGNFFLFFPLLLNDSGIELYSL